jgi:hypothetical protein
MADSSPITMASKDYRGYQVGVVHLLHWLDPLNRELAPLLLMCSTIPELEPEVLSLPGFLSSITND